jgi:hypothetical protein
MRLTGVETKDVPRVWPHVERYIENACHMGTGELTSDSLLHLCMHGMAMLGTVLDERGKVVAAVITQMCEQPDGNRVCLILSCGGERMKNWVHLIREIETGARRYGASEVRFQGRAGWTKFLPDYQIVQLVYQKDLRH